MVPRKGLGCPIQEITVLQSIRSARRAIVYRSCVLETSLAAEAFEGPDRDPLTLNCPCARHTASLIRLALDNEHREYGTTGPLRQHVTSRMHAAQKRSRPEAALNIKPVDRGSRSHKRLL